MATCRTRPRVVSDNTVKTHVTRIVDKLDLHDHVHAVISIHQTGLVERSVPPAEAEVSSDRLAGGMGAEPGVRDD